MHEHGPRWLQFELSSFIGREREVSQVLALLDRTRLVTLVGQGGVGKSRLAARVAHERAARTDQPVTVVDLSGLAEPDLLGIVIADAFGLRGAASHLSVERLAASLGDRALTLVLDNCEQLLAACSDLATSLLTFCPRVRLLATSRERLAALGETIWLTPPLQIPSADAGSDDVRSAESVQLFVERATESDSRFQMTAAELADVAQICRKLEGLPLAIELAAARVGVLSISQIADLLDDPLRLLARTGGGSQPSRHQTMRNTLDWSTALLGPSEYRLFWRCSVFAGTWDLDAARAVCADDLLASAEVADVLARLVGCSLVQRGQVEHPRYRLAEIVRAYALEQLEASGEEAWLRRRHAEWARRTVEAMTVGEGRADQIERLNAERDNLRSALAWAVEHRETDIGFSIATRLHGLWYMRSAFRESRLWFARLLALPGGADLQRIMVQVWASNDALAEGDLQAALDFSGQASVAASHNGEPLARALALDALASILLVQGELRAAADAFERELLACGERAELAWLRACALSRLALIRLEDHEPRVAQGLLDEALSLAASLDNGWIELRVSQAAGRIAIERCDLLAAAPLLTGALEVAQGLGDLSGTILVLLELARMKLAAEQARPARQYLAAALPLAVESGEPLAFVRTIESTVALIAGARPRAAVHLAAAASSFRQRYGMGAWPLDRASLERALAPARQRLGVRAVLAWAAGEALDEPAVTNLAREVLLGASDPAVRVGEGDIVLTPREQHIAALVSGGLANRAIAEQLTISEGTVRTHVEHILRKLGLRSRAEIRARHFEVEPGIGVTTKLTEISVASRRTLQM